MPIKETKKPASSRAASAPKKNNVLKTSDFETIINDAPIAIAILGRDGTVLQSNKRWIEQGWTRSWKRFEETSTAAKHDLKTAFVSVLRGESVNSKTSPIDLGDGQIQFARWALRPWQFVGGRAKGAILYVKDVTAELSANKLANERQAILEAVLNNIDEAVFACDVDGELTYSNRRVNHYRYKPAIVNEDDKPRPSDFAIYDEAGNAQLDPKDLPTWRALNGDVVKKQRFVYHSDEETKGYVEVSAQKIIDDEGIERGAVTAFYEVTDRIKKEQQLKRSEAEARRIAYSDVLTGFPNRASLQRTLQQDPATLCKDGEKLLIMSVDIRRFKAINDIHGQNIGDRLLAEVSDQMAEVAGPRTIVGRLAGDEFVIISPVDPESAFDVAQNITHLMDGQHIIEGHRLTIQMMIGAALWPDDGKNGQELFKRADMARRHGKQTALTSFTRFHPNLEAAANRQRQIEHDLRRTIQNDGLDVAYQPIVEAQTGRVLGFEALCRWIHEEHGFIAPDQFIAVAEQTGDILDLGEWMIRKVMQDLADYPGYFVAVNVSPIQFSDTQFVPRLKDALVEFNFDPSRLEIEVTENLVVHDPEQVLAQIRDLQAMGIRIALDDFGTGYSSLAYLQTYKFDKLKIDRTFVSKLGQDREALALVQCMIQMGKAMQMEVVAEGIETEGQALMLRHAGCNSFQGYFYAKPAPWSEAKKIHLKERKLSGSAKKPKLTEVSKAAS